MINQFTNYKNAKLLKELGFDEPCITSYDTDGRLRNPFDYKNSEYTSYLSSYIEDAEHFVQNTTLNSESGFIAAPLFQQAFQWLSVEFGEFQMMSYNVDEDNKTLHKLLSSCQSEREAQSKLEYENLAHK